MPYDKHKLEAFHKRFSFQYTYIRWKKIATNKKKIQGILEDLVRVYSQTF